MALVVKRVSHCVKQELTEVGLLADVLVGTQVLLVFGKVFQGVKLDLLFVHLFYRGSDLL